MAKKSNIEWTDSTVNFWWGCTKVGPGCDHCYAETWSNRTGGNIWGTGVPRRKIKSAVALLRRLDNGYSDWAADAECRRQNAKAFGLPVPHIYRRRRVFIQSMSDLFDLEVPVEWFAEAWQTIEHSDRLHIQVVTKRISAVEKRLAEIGVTAWPTHVGLMITVCNQAEADRDIQRLLALKMKLGIPWVGLSMEPLLGPVDFSRHSVPLTGPGITSRRPSVVNALTGGLVECGVGEFSGQTIIRTENYPRLDWVICGGESGPNARPMHPDWARGLRDQCAAAGVPFFFKQWGEWLPVKSFVESDADGLDAREYQILPDDGEPVDASTDKSLRRAVTGRGCTTLARVGKKAAGRLLDRREHNDMPRAFR